VREEAGSRTHESRWSKAQSRAEEERERTKSIENPPAARATSVAAGGADPRHAGGFVCRGGGDGARGRGWVIFQDGRALFGGKLWDRVPGTGWGFGDDRIFFGKDEI
jgi:hypothetical protein